MIFGFILLCTAIIAEAIPIPGTGMYAALFSFNGSVVSVTILVFAVLVIVLGITLAVRVLRKK